MKSRTLSFNLKTSFLILIITIGGLKLSAQTGNTCADPLPFCTGTNYNFPAGVNSGTAQPGPDYGCLGSEPNPVWYYMQVEDPGLIQIYMVGTNNGTTPTNDIDFICYGPFASLANVCTGQLTAGNTVDCSYSAAPTETVDIPNAQTGNFYLLLITNFSNQPCNIIFSQSNAGAPGAGSTDCGILSDANNNGPICEGDTLILTGSEQTGGTYTYNWYLLPDYSTPVGSTSEVVIFPTVTSQSGTYAFVVNDVSNGDADTSFTDVIIYGRPDAGFLPLVICHEDPVNFLNTTTLSDNLGSTQDSWFWSFGHNDNVGNPATSTEENPTHTFPEPGNYQVGFWVESNFGCRDSITQAFKVIDKPKPNFSYEMLCFQEVLFTNLSQQGDYPFQSVNWNFGDGSGTFTGPDSLVSYSYASPSSYMVSLTITDTAGCVSDTLMQVDVTETPGFSDLPNVLTPNGDNTNDDFTFLPIHDECYNYSFAVFNRWGAKVFETESSTKGFEGISGLGSKLTDGVYFWVLSADGIGPNGEKKILKKGSITLAGTK